MLGTISSFHHIRPPNEFDQEKALEWIAQTHARAECGEGSEYHPFLAEIQHKLARVGLGKEKIQNRGLLIKDLSVATSEIYSHGFARRSEFFDNEVSKIFEQFYPEGTPLPSHLVHVTCTGYVAPSPAQKLVSLRNAGPQTTVTHAYHMGCYGAISGVRIAAGYAFFSPTIDIVHTEVCSLHMHPLRHRSEQLLVESLFADGFIKYSVQKETPLPHLKILALREETIPQSSHAMSWRCEDSGLVMTLSKDVPILIARAVPGYLERLIGPKWEKVVREAYFAVHPGGPKILQQIKDLFQLQPHQMSHSEAILKAYGNMSSATLPHIWERMLGDPEVPQGAPIISMAFGPGLSIAGGLFQKC